MLSPLLPWMGSGSPPPDTSLSALTLAQKREHAQPTCPAGLLENPKSTGRNRPAPSLPKTFPPICHGQGSGPDLDFSHPDGRPSSRPHAGRQVWPKLHYRYLITSPSQQESNPTGTSSFLLHFYSWGKFCPRRLWVNARCSPSPKFTKTPLIYGRLPTASTWQTQQPTQS